MRAVADADERLGFPLLKLSGHCRCPPGTRMSAGVCQKCPFPDYTDDSMNCKRCPEPERQVPNSKGDECECMDGFYDSFRGKASRQLDIFCWSGTRLDDPELDTELLNALTSVDLRVENRRCVSCPACMECRWQPLDENVLNLMDGRNATFHSVINQLSNKFEVVGLHILPGYAFPYPEKPKHLNPAAVRTRWDFFACPGGDVSCSGFELQAHVTPQECTEFYQGFLCSGCGGLTSPVEGVCVTCDGTNW
jgi:hypothetical protein